MSEELVEKGEMEMEQSALLVGHTSEVGTHCKLLARFRTISGFAENWASFGLLELRGPSALATLESLGLLESRSIPIFWKSESESDPNATWCTATKLRTTTGNAAVENCGDTIKQTEHS